MKLNFKIRRDNPPDDFVCCYRCGWQLDSRNKCTNPNCSRYGLTG